jgi:UDP-glucose 4-epimerase
VFDGDRLVAAVEEERFNRIKHWAGLPVLAAKAVCGPMCEPKVEGEVFNIGPTEAITIVDLARRIIQMTQSRSEIVFLSYEEAYGEGFDDIRNRVPDVTKIRRFLDSQPQLSLDEILRDTIESITLAGK